MISIVIPTLNRGRYIKGLLVAVNDSLRLGEEAYEVIIVDDGSSENNRECLRDLALELRRYPFQNMMTKFILLEDNVGQQNATLAGIAIAKGDYVVTMDDDLQYDPKMIIKLMDEIDKGYDVVYGVPKKAENGHYRLVGTRLKEWVFYKFLGKPYDIRLTSFRVMKRSVVEDLLLDHGRKVYLSARILQKTTNIGQVEIIYRKGQNPNSRYKWYLLVKVIGHLVIYYSKIPGFKLFRRYGDQYRMKEILS